MDRPKEETALPVTATAQPSAAPSGADATVVAPCAASPLTVPPKKKHPRCAVCNKKTGLASSYTCRWVDVSLVAGLIDS